MLLSAMMSKEEFERIVLEEFAKIPPEFRAKAKNVAFVVEDEVSDEVRREQGLAEGEELLGYYHGVPLTERGVDYGIGMTLPDMIFVYQRPSEEEAGGDPERLRTVVRETVFHEVAHLLGMSEYEVAVWEEKQIQKK